MKNLFFLFLSCTFILSLSSCDVTLGDEEEAPIEMKEFTIEATASSESITLSWTAVDGVSWYFANYAPTGDTKVEDGGYQNLNTDEMSHTVYNLEPNTEYEIYLEGGTYLTGGDRIARSNTLTVSTQP